MTINYAHNYEREKENRALNLIERSLKITSYLCKRSQGVEVDGILFCDYLI